MPHKDYYHNGIKLVSATELQSIIHKPFLDKWRESLCTLENGQCGFIRAKQIAEEAADLGNQIHEDVADWFNGDSPKTDWGLKIIVELNKMHVKKYLIDPETHLIDNESNLSGSPDFIGTDENKTFIGDLKIKNQLDSLTGMQGAAYRYLIKRLYNVDINRMLILWAQKKSKNMTVKPVWINLDEWVEPWKSLVNIWNCLYPKRRVVLE